MHASNFSILFIMVFTFSFSLETTTQLSNSKIVYQTNNTRLTQRFKIYNSQKATNEFSKSSPSFQTSHTLPLTSPRRKHKDKRHNHTSSFRLNKDLMGLFRRSFLHLIGSDDLLTSKHTEASVPTYIMDLYRQSLTRQLWRNSHRRFKQGWFVGDTIRSFMPEAQKSNPFFFVASLHCQDLSLCNVFHVIKEFII